MSASSSSGKTVLSFNRIAAFLILVATGVACLFILLQLASFFLKGVFLALDFLPFTSSVLNVLLEHATLAFILFFVILAAAFGVLLKTVLLKKVPLIRRLKDLAFGLHPAN